MEDGEGRWIVEAEGVVRDVKDHVQEIHVANIKSCNWFIYLNVTTAESEKFCIELSASGFRIVGKEYDTRSIENGQYFETPYALLDHISGKYRGSFGNALISKLSNLKDDSD
uniref:GSKIP domain-containing protein n=1 Tax=Timema poppense TaxID=170557 RepID=A0A7R9HHQ5_TIMPO|nr:unnamed protein product [Timema poppensis]